MADRRRVNGPPSGTRPTVFASSIQSQPGAATERPRRQRQPNELRKICEYLQSHACLLQSTSMLTNCAISLENRHYSLSVRLQLCRIRALSFSLRRTLLSQISYPPIIRSETFMHSPRPQTPSTICHVLSEYRAHHAREIRPVCCAQA